MTTPTPDAILDFLARGGAPEKPEPKTPKPRDGLS
jgi:hypothetical protein